MLRGQADRCDRRGHGQERNDGADPGQLAVGDTGRDRETSDSRSDRVAEVEGALIERRREVRCGRGFVDDSKLQERHEREGEHAPHE